MKQTGVILRLMRHAGKYKPFMVLSWMFAAIAGVLLFGPYICMYFVGRELLTAGDTALLNTGEMVSYGWLAVKTTGLSFMFYGIALVFSHTASFNLIANLRIQTLRRLGELPLGFHATTPSGKLRKIIEKNAEDLDNFVAHQLPDTVQAMVMAVTFLASMFYFDWRLSLVCMLPIAAGFFQLRAILNQTSSGFVRQYQESLGDMSNAAVEYVRGVSVVKIFGQTVYSFKRFHNAIMTYKKFVTQYALSMEKPMSLYITAVHGIFFLLIPAGIVLHQWSESKERFILSFVFFMIFTPLAPLLLMRIVYRSSRQMVAEQALDTLEGLLDKKTVPRVKNPKEPAGYDIVFDSVFFRYEPESPLAIDNLSFTAEQGTVTALVGPSGGGKTTVANLLCRFWDPDCGSICVGGVDVREMDYEQWLGRVSFVFQDTRLFKMTIAGNVAFNKPDAKEEEIRHALHLAQCDDILAKLPGGIHTVIGTKGLYLSGGEMQRIALAGAILKESPVVVLDEATAFADPENEYRIQKALDVLMKGKTVLMIAHRLSTVTEADRIIVMNNGRIDAEGSHGMLMRQGGLYAGMFKEYQTSAAWKIGGDIHA